MEGWGRVVLGEEAVKEKYRLVTGAEQTVLQPATRDDLRSRPPL